MKISEKKALEAYPIESHEFYDCDYKERNAFKQGYNQAFQDFMEKAENAISMISRHYIGEEYSFEQVWEQFKNYMEDEN